MHTPPVRGVYATTDRVYLAVGYGRREIPAGISTHLQTSRKICSNLKPSLTIRDVSSRSVMLNHAELLGYGWHRGHDLLHTKIEPNAAVVDPPRFSPTPPSSP